MKTAAARRELDGWMFRNPHPINLARLRFVRTDGTALSADDLTSVSRRYDLWSGLHASSFTVEGEPVVVETCVHPKLDLIAVRAESALLREGQLIEALDCYQKFLPVATQLARQFDYRGAKWGKQVGPEGRTAPWDGSFVLHWQQPHPLFFAKLEYRLRPNEGTLAKSKDILFATADYMADFPVRDHPGVFHLAPIMPPSEQGITRDTVFDLAYLPGNGGLLYAVAMMAAGWGWPSPSPSGFGVTHGAPTNHAPGFPQDGSWVVRWEGLQQAP